MTGGAEYGKALFMLAEERGGTELCLRDLAAVCEILKQNPKYVKLLDTPAVTKAEKLALIDEAFASLDGDLVSLIKILAERHSVYTFFGVRDAFVSLYNSSRGIEEAEAVSAVPMDDTQLKRLREKLEAMTGKKILLKNTVSPEILGGVKLRFSGKQIDGSVRTRLQKFEESLKNTVI